MMRSLYSGVSGLKTHQTKMDVIGNNIANVNTVAYKSSSVTFSELMYQTTTNATSANADTGTGGVNAKQIGLGVTMGATNVSITTTGATQTTGNPFDIKITGDSFFIVSNGSQNYFTRAGAFYVDAVGNLAMTSTGYNVMGWQVSEETGEIIQNTVSPLKIMAAKNLFSQPEATELGTCSGVLDKSDVALTTSAGKILSLSVYDDLGYEYTAKFSVKPVTTAQTTTKNVTNVSTDLETPTEITTQTTYEYSFKVGTDDIKKFTLPTNFEATLTTYAKDNNIPDGGTITVDPTVAAALGLPVDSDIMGKNIAVGIKENKAFMIGASEITIDQETMDELVAKGVYTGPTAHPVTGEDTYTKVNGTLVRYEKTYEDGTAPAVSYKFVPAGTPDPSTLGEIDLSSCKPASLAAFITSCNKTDVSNYITSESVTSTSTVAGQYSVELTELIDIANDKRPLDISVLGDTSRALVYSTADGKFQYIGAAGESNYDLHLSALGGNFHDVDIDFSTTKNVSNEGTSTIGMKAGDEDGKGAGKLLGALKGIAIDSNGKIYGSYDNGNTELLGQIAVTEFANASGLEKVGENLYQVTLNSGEFDGIGKDISAIGGSMSTGVLEMSNVDLSAEFTEMITTQRGFQANSRIITTSDTLLEELINLKR